jgi:hypothetical protein
MPKTQGMREFDCFKFEVISHDFVGILGYNLISLEFTLPMIICQSLGIPALLVSPLGVRL